MQFGRVDATPRLDELATRPLAKRLPQQMRFEGRRVRAAHLGHEPSQLVRRQEPDQTRDLAALVVDGRAPVPESIREPRAPFRAARAFERLLRRAHGLARLGELVARRVDGPHEGREVVAHLLEPFPERALEAVVAAAPPSPSGKSPRAVREGAQDDVQVPFHAPRAVLGAHELVLDVADLAHRAAQALPRRAVGVRRCD